MSINKSCHSTLGASREAKMEDSVFEGELSRDVAGLENRSIKFSRSSLSLKILGPSIPLIMT
jgi:hypothetical protein